MLDERQIKQRFGRLMDGYMTKKATLFTNRLFRARMVSDGSEFKNVSELWCPPSKLVRQGRFNLDWQSVLYASSTFNAALWEMRPKEGETIAVAICGTTPKICPFQCAHVGLYHYQGRRPTVGKVPDIRSDSRFIANLEHEKIDRKWRRIDEFLAELAIADDHSKPGLYSATSQLGETLLGIPGVEGLAYPSVAAGLSAFNLRLDPAVANRKIFIAEVWELLITNHFSGINDRPKSKPGFVMTRALRRSRVIKPDGGIEWLPGFEIGAGDDFRTIPQRVEEAQRTQTNGTLGRFITQ